MFGPLTNYRTQLYNPNRLNPARTTTTTPYNNDLFPSAIALAVLKCVCLVMNRSRHIFAKKNLAFHSGIWLNHTFENQTVQLEFKVDFSQVDLDDFWVFYRAL